MSWYTTHAPKITNGITVATGILSSADPSLFPPSWLPYVMGLNAILNIAHNVQHNAQTTPALPPPVPRS